MVNCGSLLLGDDIRGQRVHRFLRLWPHHLHARVVPTVSVELHELGDVELGLLQNLHLDILETPLWRKRVPCFPLNPQNAGLRLQRLREL